MAGKTRSRPFVVARQVLLAFLLRHGYRYSGLSYWSKAHWSWIADIKMPHRAQQITLQEYVHAVQEQLERVQRLTRQIQELVSQWQLAPLVKALQALRGVSLIVAATTVAELGDLTRFDSAKATDGLSGACSKRTFQWRHHQAGWHHQDRQWPCPAGAHGSGSYLLPSGPGKPSPAGKAWKDCPKRFGKIAWKAQVRLCGRFRMLMARGKNRNTVITATARELAAFMWAIASCRLCLA